MNYGFKRILLIILHYPPTYGKYIYIWYIYWHELSYYIITTLKISLGISNENEFHFAGLMTAPLDGKSLERIQHSSDQEEKSDKLESYEFSWARYPDNLLQQETYLALATAFVLLNTSSSDALRLVQSHRICGDCHNTIKFIAMVTRREIIVGDASRFHRFKDGNCSCGDYW